MNDLNITKKIAEACNFRVSPINGISPLPTLIIIEANGHKLPQSEWKSAPDYPNDIEAMQKALACQDEDFNDQFSSRLVKRAQASEKFVHQLSAKDWAMEFCGLVDELVAEVPAAPAKGK